MKFTLTNVAMIVAIIVTVIYSCFILQGFVSESAPANKIVTEESIFYKLFFPGVDICLLVITLILCFRSYSQYKQKKIDNLSDYE